MRNPAIFYKRSDRAFLYTMPESNSLCVATSHPFRFRGLCFYFALLTISTIDIPAARSMQNGSFKLWQCSKDFFCLTRGPSCLLEDYGARVQECIMIECSQFITIQHIHCIRVGPTGGLLHRRKGRDHCKCRQYTFKLCVRERVKRWFPLHRRHQKRWYPSLIFSTVFAHLWFLFDRLIFQGKGKGGGGALGE